jgi:hypothetical protein
MAASTSSSGLQLQASSQLRCDGPLQQGAHDLGLHRPLADPLIHDPHHDGLHIVADPLRLQQMPELITKIVELADEPRLQSSARAHDAGTLQHAAAAAADIVTTATTTTTTTTTLTASNRESAVTVGLADCSSDRDRAGSSSTEDAALDSTTSRDRDDQARSSANDAALDSTTSRDRDDQARSGTEDAALDCAAMRASNELIASQVAPKFTVNAAAAALRGETKSSIGGGGNRSSQHHDHHQKPHQHRHHHHRSDKDRRPRSSSPVTNVTATAASVIAHKHGYTIAAAYTGRDSKGTATAKLLRRRRQGPLSSSTAPATFQYGTDSRHRERTIFVIDQDECSQSVVAVDRSEHEEAIVVEKHIELLTCSSNDSGAPAAMSCAGIDSGSADYQEYALVTTVTADQEAESSEKEQEERGDQESVDEGAGTRSCSADNVLDRVFAPPGMLQIFTRVPFSDCLVLCRMLP